MTPSAMPDGSAVLGPAPDAAALGARLRRGATRRGDPQHAHRLEPEPELLAAVRRGDVEAGEVADALEPVAHRVPVREQPLRGPGHVAVAVEIGLERLDQLGL